MASKRTIAAFDAIAKCSLFRTDGPEIDIAPALIELAQAVHVEPEDDDSWLYLGEGGEFCASDLIVGAYWAMTECHGGQSSPGYAALSALGMVFSPGMTSPPESDEDGPEYWPYKAICEHLCPAAE